MSWHYSTSITLTNNFVNIDLVITIYSERSRNVLLVGWYITKFNNSKIHNNNVLVFSDYSSLSRRNSQSQYWKIDCISIKWLFLESLPIRKFCFIVIRVRLAQNLTFHEHINSRFWNAIVLTINFLHKYLLFFNFHEKVHINLITISLFCRCLET